MSDGVNPAIPADGAAAGFELVSDAFKREPRPDAGDPAADDATAQTTLLPSIKATPPPYFPAAEPGPAAEPAPPGSGTTPTGPSDLLARIPRRSLIIAGGLLTVGAAGGIAAAVASGGSGSKQLPNNAGQANAGIAAAPPSAPPSPTYPPATLTTVPANGASNVDPSQPVTVTVANGTISSVELSGGQTTSGTLSPDKSTWTSNGALQINTSYTLQVQAANQGGKPVTATASFSTLKPTATLGVAEIWPGDGMSVGVGQPIRVQFTNYIPKEYRAAVEKACVVTTTPAVAGAWYWVQDDMMDWRPQNFWQTGTQVSAALNLSGVRAGQHQYGVKNHSLNFTIRDTDLRLIIDAAAYHATCYQNGQVVRTFPIDTGMNDPRFVTWSGTFAVLDKGNPVEMKGDYGNGDKYDELVTWATQITYSGTYVHAAPWDGEIGHVNSSHGCIHCYTADATWFYNQAHVGDMVQITGTSKNVPVTNGFGDFGVSWSSWLAGSAYGATIGGKPTNA